MEEKERILIVDDDEGTRKTLTLIFGKKGYEIETAGTGREAIEKGQGKSFNLALLDIRLPDMEGIELIAPLKEMHPDMAVIMVTAYASLETAVRALNDGASAYITKPLNMDEVLATVREALEKQFLLIENRRLYQAAQQELAERKRLEAQLIQSAKMASLGVMAGGIAHEIRNPLSICLLGAEFLLKNPHDRVIREQCADKIYLHVNRASRIIENLIKFARPSADDRGPIDLNETLKATLSLTKNQIALQGIELNRQFARELPPVIGNINLLQQVFFNIIVNAYNAMPEGGKLTISTMVNPEGKAEVRFADTGCGIPREHLDNIFDPFFTTMPAGKGTGLGLSVSYGIIKEHGGSIEVESTVGAGTTFTVKLPLARDDRAGLET